MLSKITSLLDSLFFDYEILSDTFIRLFLPGTNDYTSIEICNGTDISFSGKIIGKFDDLRKELINIRYYAT